MAFFRPREEAGIYARRRYRRGVARYRRRVRPVLVLFMAPFIAAGIASYVVGGRHFVWVSGFACGLAAGAAVMLRETPPAYIANWELGAEGEERTKKALEKLDRASWLVLHDVDSPRGNYDHIVVGPAGVFMLDSKNDQGFIELSDGRLRLRRRLDPDADSPVNRHLSGALAGAARLKEELQRRTGVGLWVQAVVVVWADFDAGIHQDGRCVVVHGSRVLEWLRKQPSRLDAATVDKLAAGIQAIASTSPKRG